MLSQTWSASEHFVDFGHFIRGSCDQAGASVSDGLAPTLTELGGSKLNTIHLELPIALAGDGDVSKVTLVMSGIGAAQEQLQINIIISFVIYTGIGFVPHLAANLARRITVQVEAKDGLDLLLSHHVGKDGCYLVHGNVRVAHAQDTIELGRHKGHAGLTHGLGKGLIRNVNATHVDDVSGEEARETARAITDFEFFAVGLVRGGGLGVVLPVTKRRLTFWT